MKKKPTSEELHRLFHYDPSTGLLVRKITTNYNSKAGTVVGSLDGRGYLQVSIKKKTYKIHRIVYCMHKGYWPENGLDHINRNKTDNRIENLREASQSCNMKNSKLRSDNKSGVKGIYWSKREHRWHVSIMINKKRIFLGYFKDLDSAVAARFIAEMEHSWNKCDEESSAYQYLVEHNLID